jgi:serine protease Do
MEEPTIWAGMESVLVTDNLARALNVPQEAGLLITKVSSKGAVSSLGLQGGYIPAIIEDEELLIGGDIILEIADIPVKDTNSLFEIRKKLFGFSKGASISIKILRNGAVRSGTFQKL